MLRYFAVLATALCLAGCDNMSAAFTSASDRINAAFPLPEELQTASARLLSSLEAAKPAQQQTAEQLAKLLKVRALTCTATAPVGRFDSPAKIRTKVTDPTCFKQQDALLEEWIGMRRIGLALREAPAYPATPLPAKTLLPSFAETVMGVLAAADANVLVVKGQQRFTAVQLPGGKQFSSFAVAEQNGRAAALSPNGRLLAVPVAKGLRIVEVGSGNVVWNTEKYTELVAWLPALDLVVLTQAGTGTPHVLDARRATLETYPAAEKSLTWSLPLADGKLLVGSNTTASVMQHSRNASGALDIAPVRQWTLPGYRNGAAHLMQQGKKVVFSRGSELGWLNLESGEQGTWQLSSSIGALAKVSDTAILFDSVAPGAASSVSRVVDVEKLTIASGKDADARDGVLYGLAPRTGYVRRGSNAVVMAGSVESENPQELERVIADAQLAQQLAKVNEASAVKPLLADVPANAKLSLIGVYEPEGAVSRPGSERKAAPIRINLVPGDTPLVLALASNEPVTWTINANGRRIHTILLSGYHESSVVGQGKAQVLKIGSNYAYKMDSPEYVQLKKDIARYVSVPVQAFQGGYKGREFTVQ